jgi:hypothetical protein
MSIIQRTLKPWLRLPRFWMSIAILVGWVVVIVILVLLNLGKSPPQPLAFNHKVHIDNNVQCLFCHTGANRGPSATIPTLAKCQGCHQQINPDSEVLIELGGYFERQQPIEWVPVAILPDFVYFSHQPHLAAGVNCEECHGDVGTMGIAKKQKMEMGWCLTCHRERGGDRVQKLTDCANCHK